MVGSLANSPLVVAFVVWALVIVTSSVDTTKDFGLTIKVPCCCGKGDAGNVSIEEAVRHLSENVVLMKAILERLELSIVHTTPEPPTDKVIAGVSFTALGCPSNIQDVFFVPVALVPSNIHVKEVVDPETNSSRQVAVVDLPISVFPVSCSALGYITILRRLYPFNLSFNRTWQEYRDGFGTPVGEMWLGLEKIHAILSRPNVKYSLLIEAKPTSAGKLYYAERNNFVIGDESEYYRIISVGDDIGSSQGVPFLRVGAQFSTHDRDERRRHCGQRFNGFWFPTPDNQPFQSGSILECSDVILSRDVPFWSGMDDTGAGGFTEMKLKFVEN